MRTAVAQSTKTLLLGSMIAAGLLWRCGPTPQPRPAQRSQPSDPAEPTTPTASATGVTLLHAGSTPRRKLRYRIGSNWKLELLHDTKISTRLRYAGKSISAHQYQTHMRKTLAALPSTDRETMHCSYQMTRATVSHFTGTDATALKKKAALEKTAKTVSSKRPRLRLSISATGRVSTRNLPGGTKSPGDLAESAQRLQLVVVILPADAVGIGARWRATLTNQTAAGIQLTNHITYRLDAKEGKQYLISFAIQQLATPRDLPPFRGTPRRLLSRVMQGTGSARLRLDAPFSNVILKEKTIARVQMGQPPRAGVLHMEEIHQSRYRPAP